ncbi:MAG: glycosyltransferase family 39 protein [Anaerolineae bacterium]|nr:glycosyltransferase family 39 protein [Anaerolineae bacterium]
MNGTAFDDYSLSRITRIGLIIVGLILLIFGQRRLLVEYNDIGESLFTITVGLLALGFAAWGFHLPTDRPFNPGSPPAGQPFRPLPSGWLRLTLSVLSVVLVAAAGLIAHRFRDKWPVLIPIALWLVGCICYLFVLMKPGEFRARLAAFRESLKTDRIATLIVTAATLVALLARIVYLGRCPEVFSFDEAAFAHEAAAIAEGTFRGNPFGPAWLSHPRLFHYLMAIPVALFGRTVFAARLVVAIFGTLTVPAVYYLGRECFGRRVGLVSAVALSGFAFHVHFSRLALNNAVDPLFGTLAFAFLIHGLRSRRLSDFALAGLSLGLSQYFYAGARLLPLICAVWLALIAIFRPSRLIGTWPLILALILGFLIVTWPANWHYLVTGEPLTTRLGSTGLFQTGRYEVMLESRTAGEIVLYQFKNSFLAPIHTLDSTLFYGPVAPLMGRYMGVPLLIGLVVALMQPRRSEGWLLLMWIAAALIAGSVLLARPPGYARLVLIVPPLIVLVGLGIVGLVDLLPLSASLTCHWAPVGIAVALIAADLLFYGMVYQNHDQSYAHDPNTLMGREIVDYVVEEDAEPGLLHVYFATAPRSYLNRSTLRQYFLPNLLGDELVNPAVDSLPGLYDPAEDSLFIIEPGRRADLVTLLDLAPGGRVYVHREPGGEILFYSYRVPPQS